MTRMVTMATIKVVATRDRRAKEETGVVAGKAIIVGMEAVRTAPSLDTRSIIMIGGAASSTRTIVRSIVLMKDVTSTRTRPRARLLGIAMSTSEREAAAKEGIIKAEAEVEVMAEGTVVGAVEAQDVEVVAVKGATTSSKEGEIKGTINSPSNRIKGSSSTIIRHQLSSSSSSSNSSSQRNSNNNRCRSSIILLLVLPGHLQHPWLQALMPEG